MEAFDLDQDYEGGRFNAAGDFEYEREKPLKRRRFTKEDALYGVFNNVRDNAR